MYSNILLLYIGVLDDVIVIVILVYYSTYLYTCYVLGVYKCYKDRTIFIYNNISTNLCKKRNINLAMICSDFMPRFHIKNVYT